MKAPLALSLGDPAGIGPEITLKTWAALRESGPCFVAIGDPGSLDAAQRASGGSIPCVRIAEARDALDVFAAALPLLATNAPTGRILAGAPDPAHAASTLEAVSRGVDLCLSGAARGLVTAPIAKAPLYAAGFRFPGHTEYIAHLCAEQGATPEGPVMMLTAGDLRVSLVTIHLPLSQVSPHLTTQRIVTTATVTARALVRDFALKDPRIAIAGLNPHAGESGTLGREESDIIAPAVRLLADSGLHVTGPHPADTLFHPEARRAYDVVVAMYHDQGLIPVKMLDFWSGVNITLGLPIIRTSPDHGAAHDIAGRGAARPDSLIAALRLAARMADNRAQA